MENPIERDFARHLENKRRGGVSLDVGVSAGVWMGGMVEEIHHAPFVYVGPAERDGEEDLTFFADRDAVEAFIAKLRAAATEAWGTTP